MNVIEAFFLTIIILIVLIIFFGCLDNWEELKAAHKWSQVQKAHRLEDQKIGKEKNSMLGSRSKSKNS